MSFVQDCVSLSRQHLMAGYLAEAEMSCLTALQVEPEHSEATHLLGVIALRSNRAAEANDLFNKAIALDDHKAEFHNSRGVLLYGCCRFVEAAVEFAKAVELDDNDPVSHNNLGNAMRALGDLVESEQSFRRAIARRPSYAEAHNNLGNTLRDLGNLGEAEFCFRHSLALRPKNLDAAYNLAALLLYTDRLDEAGRLFANVLAGDPSRGEAAIGLAQVFQGQGRLDDAIALLTGVHNRMPDNSDVLFALQLLRSTQIPAWHIPMINDHERNDAYEAALLNNVQKGDVVLEIGTGSALVAMMAARAGAGHVYTCEMHKPLVEVARETVAVNGYSDRVSVIGKKSTDLVIGSDMPEKADIFVSELINVGMLAPDMLAILQHARQNLLRQDAKIIPAAATVWCSLIQADDLRRISPIRTISGFDMSRFDQFRTPGYCTLDLAADNHQLLSTPEQAWFFDFYKNMPTTASKTLTITASETGTAHGVAFWFDLHMDEKVTYNSNSPTRTNHWKQAVYFFGQDLPVVKGQPVMIGTGYDRTQIHFYI
ncbi:tetratricopeptide repeat protein [Niveispirillum sp. SYP-B3756]|uniref:tetratricopeptide repeat protein n=1 Tax=Niveispirillum sp. SYP-B3756 TaxID=2662178 RepID=UPI0012919665|nr:tetratricopeptide repeat protein [Niveispirillum sp. SYP-B3756]MQP66332.1 tetratricopeptide repeat protein [Niveispirillum sp. SYP-B3756]